MPIAVAMGLAMFVASLSWQVPVAQASGGALDAQSSEMVRLINGARVAAGHRALNVDPTLASLGRNGAIPCPDDAAKTIAGRSQDFAAWGQMSHDLRRCDASGYALSGTAFVSTLQSHFGYGAVGEIDVVNGGYGNGAFLYTSGSWKTWTYSTTGHAMLGWASSSSHWNIVMGSYSGVGCGGWSSGSTYYYDCAFESGDPHGVRSPPTTSPFSQPVPTAVPKATPPPAPVITPAPVATYNGPPSTGGGGGGNSGSSGGSSGSTGTPGAGQTGPAVSPTTESSASPTSGVAMIVPPNPTATAAAALLAGLQTNPGGLGPADGRSPLLALIALIIALIAYAGAAVLGAVAMVPSIRRRRETAD